MIEPPSFRELIEHAGFALCAIDRGSKSPRYLRWNENPIPADAADGLHGAGILHVQSKTCCIDVDALELARPWLLQRGVDLDALLTDDRAVRIESGRPGRTKLLYRMNLSLRTVQPKGSGLEFRCATANGKSVQDVAPPSQHPDTKKPYCWKLGILGDWYSPPPIPASLLALWRSIVADDTSADETPASPTPAPVTKGTTNHRSEQRQQELVSAYKQVLQATDPDSPYDEWVKLGMRGNDGDPSVAGPFFTAWDTWSSKGKKYPGREKLAEKWRSFSSIPGKHVATIERIEAELPATADEFENVDSTNARPVVSLNGGELHNYVAQCEQILAGDVYVRERQLVRIGGAQELAPERSESIQRDASQAAIIPATTEYLRRRLNQRARFRRYRHREKAHAWVDCPKEVAINIVGQGDWPGFRRLVAIARAPFVRPDGSICEAAGYDAASCVYYEPNASFPPVSANPTRDDALHALQVLLEPFAEFPFATDAAPSAFAALVFTEIVRPAVATSPVFFLTAPSPGTGKTLLSEMPARIVHGCGPALRPWVEGEEMRKNLFSSLLAGDRTIGFDNLPNGVKVRSPILCGFVTAETYSDRKLGSSDVPVVPNRSVVFLTGNNLTPVGDLARRSIVIRLDANTANLRERSFRIADLRGHVAANRPALLVAALTILKAYVLSGARSGKAPLPSFEGWSRFVREPLLWLGMPDPTSTQHDEADDEAAPLTEAFELIAAEIGDREFTAADLATRCDLLISGDGPLPTALEATGCGAPTDPARVGYWLREKRDRIAGHWKLVRGNEAHGAGRKWCLRRVP
jgi:hypothetical protein